MRLVIELFLDPVGEAAGVPVNDPDACNVPCNVSFRNARNLPSGLL